MRILAVDPGEKRLGIAISDPSGTIASPLKVVKHISRSADAAAIVQLAEEHQAGLIVIGENLDVEGEPTLQSIMAARLAETIRAITSLPVVMWDESGSTQAAREARIAMGVRKKKRRGHMDDLAAAVILQSYLDARSDDK
jgi:putative holliday junction resolvase